MKTKITKKIVLKMKFQTLILKAFQKTKLKETKKKSEAILKIIIMMQKKKKIIFLKKKKTSKMISKAEITDLLKKKLKTTIKNILIIN